MLGVVQVGQGLGVLTNYFTSTPYENAFLVDADGRLICEVDQREWRFFLHAHHGPDIEISEAVELLGSKRFRGEATPPRPAERKARTHLLEPLYDSEGRVKGTRVRTESVEDRPLAAHGLIMAGGFGRRLGELTKTTPKPMLPLRDHPIAQHLVENLVDNGITSLFMSLFYLGDVVSRHFGDGARFGAEIRYLTETVPLGTGGCLALAASQVEHPLVVVNGDVVTNLQFSRLLEFHETTRADVTISVRRHSVLVPYGVVDRNSAGLVTIHEKPRYVYDINTAIYVFSPGVLQHMRPGQKIDMPDFIQNLLVMGYKCELFPIYEDWVDIGSVPEYTRARESFNPSSRPTLSPPKRPLV